MNDDKNTLGKLNTPAEWDKYLPQYGWAANASPPSRWQQYYEYQDPGFQFASGEKEHPQRRRKTSPFRKLMRRLYQQFKDFYGWHTGLDMAVALLAMIAIGIYPRTSVVGEVFRSGVCIAMLVYLVLTIGDPWAIRQSPLAHDFSDFLLGLSLIILWLHQYAVRMQTWSLILAVVIGILLGAPYTTFALWRLLYHVKSSTRNGRA